MARLRMSLASSAKYALGIERCSRRLSLSAERFRYKPWTASEPRIYLKEHFKRRSSQCLYLVKPLLGAAQRVQVTSRPSESVPHKLTQREVLVTIGRDPSFAW